MTHQESVAESVVAVSSQDPESVEHMPLTEEEKDALKRTLRKLGRSSFAHQPGGWLTSRPRSTSKIKPAHAGRSKRRVGSKHSMAQ